VRREHRRRPDAIVWAVGRSEIFRAAASRKDGDVAICRHACELGLDDGATFRRWNVCVEDRDDSDGVVARGAVGGGERTAQAEAD
jgi:hypothetical protein